MTFVILDQLVIGQPLLVQLGLLVSDLRPFTLALRLLLGSLGPALGLLSAPPAHRGVLAIFTDDTLSAAAKLTFTSSDAGALP